MELDKLYNMDCLEGMRQIPTGGVDCIICDLPYGTINCAWDNVIPFDKLWEQYKRIIKPTGTIILFGSEPFSTMLRMSNFEWYKYDLIWIKSRAADFLNCKHRPMKLHETISVFSKSSIRNTTYNPQGVRKVCKVRNNGKSKFGNSSTDWNYHTQYTQEYENYPTTVLRFDNDKNTFHPTQKPLSLIAYLVLTYTNPGDIVLDTCMGSGTTAVACIREKRHWIGYELNTDFYNQATARIKQTLAEPTLF